MEMTKFERQEAEDWVRDCFEDAPAVLTDRELQHAINRHYEGGWPAFVASCVA
jgi:hypothetical protein